MAELVKNHIPKLVEIHNYPSASSTSQKNYNWATLNRNLIKCNNINLDKVFKKLGFQISKQDIQDIIACKAMIIENLLKKVYKFLQKYNGENTTVNNRNNISGDGENLDISNNEKLNINKSNPYSDEGGMNYNNAGDGQLRRVIEEKDHKIEELRNIIDVILIKLFFRY